MIPLEPVEPSRAPGGDGTSLRWLLAAPHRLFFGFGMIALALSSLWWLGHLAARNVGVALPMAVSPSWMHAWTMTNGFLPFFMFGFLFTAGPKWLHVEPPSARVLFVPALLALAGFLLALAGAQVDATAVAAGALLMAAGWLPLLVRFGALVRASRFPDRLHPHLVLVFFSFGVLAQLVFALGVLARSANGVHSAVMLSVWLFLVPMYVTVAHRLFPFFVGNALPTLAVWRPPWLLAALLGIVLAHGLLPLGSVLISGPVFGVLRVAVDAGGAALLFLLVWRWGIVAAFANRLLVTIHIGLLWLGIAFALYAWNLAAQLLGSGSAALGLAPLHALTMGFFGTLAFGMVTRVTAGHGGRPIMADTLDWTLFWLLQAAVAVRLLADLWPAQMLGLTALAVFLWCAAFLPWALRKTLIVLRPRPDGLEG
jgi:uncharacterized protein involved in response to NO